MRSLLGHSGTCDHCNKFAYLWVDRASTLDLGTGAPPIETECWGIQLCDDCEHIESVRRAYASNPVMAQRMYGVNPADVERYVAMKRREAQEYDRREAERERARNAD